MARYRKHATLHILSATHHIYLFLEIIGHIGVIDHLSASLLHSGAVLRPDFPVVFKGGKLIAGNELGLSGSGFDGHELGLTGLDVLEVTAAHLISSHRVLLVGILVLFRPGLQCVDELVRLILGPGGVSTSEEDGSGSAKGGRSDLTTSGRKGRRCRGLGSRRGSKGLGRVCRSGDDQSGDDLHDGWFGPSDEREAEGHGARAGAGMSDESVLQIELVLSY